MSFYDILIGLCFFLTVLTCYLQLLCWLVNHTDSFGRLYAMLFIWLQERLNISIVRSKLRVQNQNVFTFIKTYSRWFYWVMCLDRYRMNAYKEAVKQAYKHSSSIKERSITSWLDIGTGAHMPLTRLLLEQKAAKHVHAVEANSKTYRCARKLHQSMPSLKSKVTLHNEYSADINWSLHEPRPQAIIHEIVGTVSSAEGCIKVVHDTIAQLKHVSLCIPYEIGTYCIPVSHPKISWLSTISSILCGGPMNISSERGVQCIYNPPKNVFLSTSPQFVEKFVLEKAQPSECLRTNIEFIVESNHEENWSGFYLSPYVLTANQLENGKYTIDGLKQNTCWGVCYINMVSKSEKLTVKKGDKIKVLFQANLSEECPSYQLEAWINDIHVPSVNWKGPQDNMMVSLF